MKILADRNIYKLDGFLPNAVEISSFDPAEGIPDITNYDALFVRTVTRLNKNTLPRIPSKLKMIATASAGIDHIDVDYFTEKEMKVVNAKGCNAQAVAEYVITALLFWSDSKSIPLENLRFGIIGAGAVGSAVQRMFERFGLSYLAYDPPREEHDLDFKSASLKNILNCDVLTFHVPLVNTGPWSTFHWLNADKLAGRKYALVINASRGGVVDETAVAASFQQGNIGDYIIDVWENEPDFNPDFAGKAFIATPHIAGYSEQAKTRATEMIVHAFTDYFGFNISSHKDFYPVKAAGISTGDGPPAEILKRLNPILDYNRELRNISNHPQKGAKFRKLRETRTYRFEYGYMTLDKDLSGNFNILQKLGFRVQTD